MIRITPSGRGAASVGLAVLTLACATPVAERDVEVRLRRAAGSVRGLGGDYQVVPIHADSRVAAWTLLAEARGDGATAASERLSHELRREARRGRPVVVGGVYSQLTREILLDAFGLLGDRSLDGLTLVYVGDASHASELRQAARARQARFYHRALP